MIKYGCKMMLYVLLLFNIPYLEVNNNILVVKNILQVK